MKLNQSVAIIAHDAGGAELLACYVLENKNLRFNFSLAGPAIQVFKRRFKNFENLSIEDAVEKSTWCLSGTGWQSQIEWDSIRISKSFGKKIISFLDHWTNYQERFIRNGMQQLPDEIWVGDEHAKKLANQLFNVPIILVPNPYFIDLEKRLNQSMLIRPKNKLGNNVLFACENITDYSNLRFGDRKHFGYDDFDVLEYFFNNIQVLGVKINEIVVRPHPSDLPGKYEEFLKRYGDKVRLSNGQPLLEEIIAADIIAGCEGTAMVVGLLAKKKVISCIPPHAAASRLPQKEIINLRDLVAP